MLRISFGSQYIFSLSYHFVHRLAMIGGFDSASPDPTIPDFSEDGADI
jgi:hypothetical protein